MDKVGAVITGGDFQGLGVMRSLSSQGVPICLVDSHLCIARFSRCPKKFIKSPSVLDEDAFMHFFITLAEKQGLEGWVVYPNDDDTVCLLAKHKQKLEKYYRIPTPSWDVVKYAIDKSLTYQLAESCDVAIPKTFYPGNIKELDKLGIGFPVVVRPSVKEPFYRRTKKKAILAENQQQLRETVEMAISAAGGCKVMVQELIPGSPDYLFGVGSTFKNGDFLGKVVVRRRRQHPMDFGHATTFAETVALPELEEASRKILNRMNYYGLAEVEFKLDPRDGIYKFLEINARPWGWHTIAITAGVNLPFLLYQDMLGYTVSRNEPAINVKWTHLVTDIPTAVREILKGKLKVSDYVDSMRGKKEDAVLKWNDPLPFIMELMLIPYLWKNRGF